MRNATAPERTPYARNSCFPPMWPRAEGWTSRASRARRIGHQRGAALLGLALSLALSLAGCGATVTKLPNPPASALSVLVTVYDHETAHHTPAGTTLLAVTLTRPAPNGFGSDTVDGSDAMTLACDGVTAQFNDSGGIGDPTYGAYLASVPPQTGAYTCVYYWQNGAQQATLTIPVVLSGPPRIQTPASRDVVSAPVAGNPALTLTYAPAGQPDVSVMGAASDFNQRAIATSTGNDEGTLTIAPEQSPPAFSVGWGTLTLTRSLKSEEDISRLEANSAFASAALSGYEQVDQIPVFWV
ncbi:MAG TPA: hypothetical protein VF808_18825 [Ktedonobacterales bacterium]